MDFSKLNSYQFQAVSYPLSPVMIMAGAGTGKTTVITNRVAYLIVELKINPNRILAITFTNKASSEMNARIAKMIGEPIEWIGTFHSVCIRILRREFHKLNRKNNFKIIGDEEDAISIIKEIYEHNQFTPNEISYKNVIKCIDILKQKMYDIENFNNDIKMQNLLGIYGEKQINILKTVYIQYQKKFEMYNYVDFNDILNFTLFILNNYKDSYEYWSNRFDAILVDEFQDTNSTQYELIELLGGQKFNVFAVGDEDQSIYTFRGANPEIIHKFIHHNNLNIPIIKLEENYRSTQQILTAANSLINHNTNRVKKNLFSTNNGPKPMLYVCNSEEEEANFVVRKIKELMIKNELKWKDFAILYRSNYLSRPYEQALVSEGIRYSLYGGYKFYQRTEIKDIIAYLNVISNSDDLSIRRIINVPRRKISDQTVKHLLDYAYQKEIDLYQSLLEIDHNPFLSEVQKNSVKKFVELIESFKNRQYDSIIDLYDDLIKTINYEEYIKNNDPKKVENIIKNIDELKNGLANYINRNPNGSLEHYLQEVALFTSLDERKNNDDSVSLMTVHTSKGLEFKYVFLVDFCDGIFPSIHSSESIDGIEEERRLAYVAITRAKNELYICANNSYNFRTKNHKQISRFLKDIQLSNLEEISPIIKTKSTLNLDWFNSTKPQFDVKNQYDDESINDYKIGDQIVHISFGIGRIIGINHDILEISFKPPHNIKNIIYNHKSIKRHIY